VDLLCPLLKRKPTSNVGVASPWVFYFRVFLGVEENLVLQGRQCGSPLKKCVSRVRNNKRRKKNKIVRVGAPYKILQRRQENKYEKARMNAKIPDTRKNV